MATPSAAAKPATSKSSDLTVFQARTAEDLQRVFAFRYKILVEDLCEELPDADCRTRIVRGPLDDSAIALVLGTRDGEIIATLRLNLSAAQWMPPGQRNALLLDHFAEFGDAALSYSSCLAVGREWRSSPALSLLVGGAYKTCRANGVRFDFVTATPGNLQAYERLGYRRYAPNLTNNGPLRIPMVLLLEDFRYLKEIGSPLWRLALTERNPTETATWFMRAFPQAQGAGPAGGMTEDEFWIYLSKRLQRTPLDGVPLLDGLSPSEAKQFVVSGTTLRCKAGDLVIRAGDRGNEMFVMLSGEAEVLAADDDSRVVAELRAGDVFGEIGYLSEVKRSASVIAKSDVEVLVLTQDYLKRVMSTAPEIACRVLFNLSLVLCDRLVGQAEAGKLESKPAPAGRTDSAI